ncbi:hypothetical protein M433DRAFT_256759 [Acidomyces richmondensis BFW]|nr:MAG: hypothetical protein FE78DRAFT_80094 [Acidomyces sp. 'richmondensis']KYG45423.1 hypothetical protein M433DRAFT_256759 [Acidomyces richmondensis BFW]
MTYYGLQQSRSHITDEPTLKEAPIVRPPFPLASPLPPIPLFPPSLASPFPSFPSSFPSSLLPGRLSPPLPVSSLFRIEPKLIDQEQCLVYHPVCQY